MDNSKKAERLTIRLPLEMKEKLIELAKAQNRKMSDYVFLELEKLIQANDDKAKDSNKLT